MLRMLVFKHGLFVCVCFVFFLFFLPNRSATALFITQKEVDLSMYVV
jgi:hypothetical protein